MIVVCPSCSARFQYPDARFKGVATKRFKCPKCGQVFEVVNPAFPEFPSSQVAPHTPTPPQDVPPPPPAPREAAPQWPASAEAAPPAVPPVPVTPREALPVPVPPAPAGPRPTETTARKEREGMLAAAGMGPGGMPKDVRFSLAFLTGPLASTVRVLDTPVTVIGREEGDLIINDPETSRRHARLEIHSDGTAWLTDLGSTNGTTIEGRRIEGPTQLVDRQEFTCGCSTFMILIRAIDSMSMD